MSDRGGKAQVYQADADGRNVEALTARKWGVESFRWSPDGSSIAYLARDDTAPDEDSGPQVADRESELARLWVLDVGAKTSRKLGVRGLEIDEFAWQGGSHLLLAATDRPRVEEFTDAVYRISTQDRRLQQIARPPEPLRDLAVSPDGSAYAVRSTQAQGPLARDLFVGSIAGRDLHDVSATTHLAVADMRWPERRTVWLRLIHGFRNELWRLPLDGTPQEIALPLSVAAFDVARNGSIAFVGEDYRHLPEIFLRGTDGHIRKLGELQQGWNRFRMAPTSLFWTRSFDGTPIEAALMTPPHARADAKLPLVILVHGGPSSNFTEAYGWEPAWAELLAAHGYEVLMVNPRGSNGYSEDFLKANRGDWGGGDYRDLIAVLDVVIARGHTDPSRLGIGGWSYGGEMSEWAITQTNRFKAAVVGAGVFDQAAEFETEGNPAGDEWYFGTPWDDPAMFARNSPSTHIRKARTPTLIFDGEEDRSNPVGQSRGLYRALKHFGVETEMVLYPGEGHSPRSRASNIDMFTRILGWYDRYVKK